MTDRLWEIADIAKLVEDAQAAPEARGPYNERVWPAHLKVTLMSDPKNRRAQRREQQTAEIEVSQANLRKSIAETERLVNESDKMLRRHRKECDDDDAIDDPASGKPISS